MTTFNRHEKLHGGKLLSANSAVRTNDGILLGLLPRPDIDGPHYDEVTFVDHLPSSVIAKIGEAFGAVFKADPEGYAIVLGNSITVYAPHPRCYLYAAYDLARLSAGGFIPQGLIYNRPNAEFRHLKVYMPPEEKITEFKEVIDLCIAYRLNRLIIEVGGAMEYKRYPEINAKWVEYCEDMKEYPRKSLFVQQEVHPWAKDSIHHTNGGGKFLTQSQVRDIVEYAKARYIEVIPEVPTLSHSDYLLLPHPEFAERPDDPYPDAYCPNAPGVYDYVFDVLQEVIDVFKPEAVHIGHDEYYSICVCPRCKDLSAPEIFAGDVNKIHGFLADQGIKTIIWCDKILNSYTLQGQPCGGAEKTYYFKGEPAQLIPATYSSIDMIPRDVICMHWYWRVREALDSDLLGYDYFMVYGNYHSANMPNAGKRIHMGAKGGGPSNWGYSTLDYLQENGILFGVAYASMLFWKDNIDDERYTEFLEFCLYDLYALRLRRLNAPTIEIFHTTGFHRPYYTHYDFAPIDYKADTLGSYQIRYTDGSTCQIPVVYGQNIASRKRYWSRHYSTASAEEITETNAAAEDIYDVDYQLLGMAYRTLPIQIAGDTYYLWRIVNPCPDKIIQSVEFEANPGHEKEVDVLKIVF